jgi:integrase/recombinase XerD
MKSLQNAIEDYIALRRSLGFKLNDMAADLTKFASFLEQKAAPYITTALALEWAMQSTDHLPSHWARRLGFVRVFARHWSATDPRTEIPPAGLLPFRAQRARPYLYTEQEIQRLLAAAKSLSPASGLRPWTYHCLFGLLAVSGLRISEAIKLERQDVDFYQGVLTIRQTKFNKNRLIPLHTSTRDVLSEYAEPVTAWCQTRALPVSCSTIAAVAWRDPQCGEPSMISRVRLACADLPTTPARGFTISGTDLPSTL